MSNFQKLIEIDSIRIMKLLELCQYSILSIFPAIIIGELINKLFTDYSKIYNNENQVINIKQFTKIIIEICLNLCLYVISLFYINKLVKIIPFLFRFNNRYIPSLKGESNMGISTGVGLFLFITQSNLANNAKLLVNRYVISRQNNYNLFS